MKALGYFLRVFLARLVFLGSKTRSTASRANAGRYVRLIIVVIRRYAAAIRYENRIVLSATVGQSCL